jgi:hypothetical protein
MTGNLGPSGVGSDLGLPDRGLPDDEIIVLTLGRIRLSTCVAPMVAVGCGVVAAGTVPTISSTLLILLISVLTVAATTRPDSYAGLLLVLTICAFWAVTVPDRFTAYVVPAALSVLVLHTSLAAATTSPVDRPTAAVRRRWRLRTFAVGTVTVGVWLATRAFGAVGRPAGVVLPFAGFAFLAAAAWFVRSRSQPAGRRPPSAWDDRPVGARAIDDLGVFP